VYLGLLLIPFNNFAATFNDDTNMSIDAYYYWGDTNIDFQEPESRQIRKTSQNHPQKISSRKNLLFHPTTKIRLNWTRLLPVNVKMIISVKIF